MGLVGGGLGFGGEAGKADLRGGEAAGCEIDGRILANVEALLNDADEAIGEALLLLERGLALHVAIERKVGDGGVFGYTFTNVLEVEASRLQRSLSGSEVGALRVAED